MYLASIAMYVTPQPLAEATSSLWSFLRDYLAQAGLSDLPEDLNTTIPYNEAWLREDLLLSQTCGYPYVKYLRGKVRLVATPAYSHPGCDGPLMRSFIIVRNSSAAASLEDLRGATAAINSRDSNSGANLFRAAVLPFAKDGRFFGGITETGSHGGSIDAVSNGLAECAAIDCVTYGNLLRFEPDRLRDIRVHAESPAGPGLPFITAGNASDEVVRLLRQALAASIEEPSLADARDTLGLIGFSLLPDTEYEQLSALAGNAKQSGYKDFGA